LTNLLEHIDGVNRQIDKLLLAAHELPKQAGGVKARKQQRREDVVTETAFSMKAVTIQAQITAKPILSIFVFRSRFGNREVSSAGPGEPLL
jgi:hypothetical protein